jgi:hypothetical protein
MAKLPTWDGWRKCERGIALLDTLLTLTFTFEMLLLLRWWLAFGRKFQGATTLFVSLDSNRSNLRNGLQYWISDGLWGLHWLSVKGEEAVGSRVLLLSTSRLLLHHVGLHLGRRRNATGSASHGTPTAGRGILQQ